MLNLNPIINPFGSLKLITDSHMTIVGKQIKTHRKKRINKKWAKRYGFERLPNPNVYQVGDRIIGHPAVLEVLKNEIIARGGQFR